MDRNARLITIGRFSSTVEAAMAKNRLEEAGIVSAVVGEAVASALPLITSFHVIELQVKEEDALRATGILEGDDQEANPPDQGSDAIQAAGPITAPGTKPIQDEEDQEEVEEDEEFPDPQNAREETADRAYRSAILGCFFWPLQIYVSWLVFKVMIGHEEMKPKFRRRAISAAIINSPFFLILCILLFHLIKEFATGVLR